MAQDISKNNVNKEDLYLPFHVLEVMSAIDSYDQNGKWVNIEQQFWYKIREFCYKSLKSWLVLYRR